MYQVKGKGITKAGEIDTKVRKFPPKLNSREANQRPQGRQENGIKERCEVGKCEHNYVEEGQRNVKMFTFE